MKAEYTYEDIRGGPSPVRAVLLGFDDAGGLWHVPDEEPPSRLFNEAACAGLFSPGVIEVVVKEMPADTPPTCLVCIAHHYKRLWTVLKGTLIRVGHDQHQGK